MKIDHFLRLAVAFGLSVGVSSVILADEPLKETVVVPGIQLVDPCTGEPDVAVWTIDIYWHFHPRNLIAIGKRSGVTENGYEMVAGRFIDQSNDGNVQTFYFHDLYRRDADGSMFDIGWVYTLNLLTGTYTQYHTFRSCIRAVG